MSSEIPKTGLAKRMRDWMSSQKGNFTPQQIADGLGLSRGKDRDRLRNALGDFVRRKEVIQIAPVPTPFWGMPTAPYQYYYNFEREKPEKGSINKKIYKAMYVSVSSFAVTDIRRLSGERKKSHIEKIVRRLLQSGYLQKVGRRLCSHGAGAENLYRVTNRDRFRLQVMK